MLLVMMVVVGKCKLVFDDQFECDGLYDQIDIDIQYLLCFGLCKDWSQKVCIIVQ